MTRNALIRVTKVVGLIHCTWLLGCSQSPLQPPSRVLGCERCRERAVCVGVPPFPQGISSNPLRVVLKKSRLRGVNIPFHNYFVREWWSLDSNPGWKHNAPLPSPQKVSEHLDQASHWTNGENEVQRWEVTWPDTNSA